MFKPMAQTVTFAIIGAFILSLTYVPMMSALFLSRKTLQKVTISDRIIGFFQRLYDPALRFAPGGQKALLSLLLLASSLFAC